MRLIWIAGILLLSGCVPSRAPVWEDSSSLPASSVTATKTFATPTLTATATVNDTPAATATNTQPPLAIPHLRVVFYNGTKGVWYWQNGTSRQLTNLPLQDFKISDDGKLTAWISPGDGPAEELAVIDTESLETRTLTADESNLQDFAWIPGAHSLIYNHYSYGVDLGMLVQDLYLAEYDPPGTSVLLPWGKGGSFKSSPDGKWVYVYFGFNEAIFNISEGKYLRFPKRYVIQDFAWAPDSQYLMASAQEESHRTNSEPMYILKYRLDGSPPEVVAQYPRNYGVVFSPDLTKVLLEYPPSYSLDEELPGCQIYTANVDGAEMTCFVRDDRFAAVDGWNPDSNHFVLLLLEGYALGEVGKGTTALPDNLAAHGQNIRWVNSEYYLYCSEDNELFLASLYRPSDPIFITQTVGCLYDFAH